MNDLPVVTLPTSSITYVENAAPLVLFTNATAVDLDLASTAATTAALTVTNTNGQSTDRLSILPAGVYSIAGSELRANGVAIGSFTGGVGTTPLVISFTTSMSRIQAVLGLIGFSSTSDAPSTTPRVITVRLTDAAGGVSAIQSRTVAVTSVNDVPVLNLNVPNAVSYTRNSPSVVIAGSATVTDADQGSFAGGTITIQATSNNDSSNRIELGSAYSVNGVNQVIFNGAVIGTLSGNGVGPNALRITFSTGATTAVVQGCSVQSPTEPLGPVLHLP